MSERDEVVRLAHAIAEAIGRKDVETLRKMMAPGFVQRTFGAAASDTEAFLNAVAQIPAEILSVQLEALEVDVTPHGALATGRQFAQVRVDGEIVDDRRGFVDWFVKDGGTWKIQAAVDLPLPAPAD
jgi:hypothetical protein